MSPSVPAFQIVLRSRSCFRVVAYHSGVPRSLSRSSVTWVVLNSVLMAENPTSASSLFVSVDVSLAMLS